METAVTKAPFSLAGMGDMLRETNADLASKTGVDEVEPPKIEPSADAADDKPDETPEPGADATPKPDDNAAATPTEDELAAEQQRQQDETAAAAEDKKKKDDEAAAQKAKDEEAAKAKSGEPKPDDAREKRDADLNVNLSPHTHPKTRQIITSFKENARKARDERDAIAREREELKQKLTAAEEKSKGVALPTEVDEELKMLRERVRELDISKDPQIEAKYDRPMAANNKSVVDLLKSFGADHVVDPKDDKKTIVDPRWEANLLKSGLSFKTLDSYIKQFEKAGYIDEAEQLREAVRTNLRLAQAKQQEIEAWKGDYDTRVKTRNAQSQQQAEQEAKAFAEESKATLESDLAELSKTLPFLNPPPAPQATDSEPVRKAKQAAVDEYNATREAVDKAVNAINPGAVPPEKARSAAAKLNATAVQGVIFKLQVLPRLQKQLAASDARIKELETQLSKFKGATKISHQHATLASQPNGQLPDIPQGAPIQDAMAAFAKGAGVNVNS